MLGCFCTRRDAATHMQSWFPSSFICREGLHHSLGAATSEGEEKESQDNTSHGIHSSSKCKMNSFMYKVVSESQIPLKQSERFFIISKGNMGRLKCAESYCIQKLQIQFRSSVNRKEVCVLHILTKPLAARNYR